MTIKITGITKLDREPSKTGVEHLAHFNASLGDIIHLDGCLLVETPTGRTVWMPKLDRAAGTTGARLGKPLRKALTDAAGATLAALDSVEPKEAPALSAAVELVRQIEERDAA